MADFWSQFLPGAANATGTAYLFNQMNKNQGDTHDTIGNLIKSTQDRTQFQPWSVRGNLGGVHSGPDGINVGLKGESLDRYNQMQRNAGTMMQRASQDPTQARDDYYGMMRAAQSPEEARQKQMMDARLQAQGRSGIKSNAYGGTPEQLAMFKAQEEAKNTAMLSADQMAQAGLMNQAQMGGDMFRNSYLPMEMLLRQGQLGQNDAQLRQQGQLAGANMENELTLGQATTDMNYDNMMADFLQQTLKGLAGGANNPLSQLGSNIDENGLWEWIKSLNPFGGN